MADLQQDVRRVEKATRAEMDSSLKTKMIGIVNDSNPSLAFKKTDGTTEYITADGGDKVVNSLKIEGLAGNVGMVGVDILGNVVTVEGATSEGAENAIQVAGAIADTFKDSGLKVNPSLPVEVEGLDSIKAIVGFDGTSSTGVAGFLDTNGDTIIGFSIADGGTGLPLRVRSNTSETVVESECVIRHPSGTQPYHSATLGQVEDLFFEDHEVTATSTGFQYPRTVDMAYDGATSKVTVQPCAVYWRGVKLTAFESVWVSPAHGTIPANTSQWLYYNGTDYLWAATIPDGFRDMPIARVYRDGVNVCIRECHGFMDAETHEALHYGTGAFLRSGGDLSDFTTGSTTATNRRPLISATAVADEDCVTDIPAITNETNAYARLTMSGASTAAITVDNADIVPLSGNNPYYYNFTGGVFAETLFPTNAYGKIFVIAIPVTDDVNCQKVRYVFIAPQQVSTTLTTIQAVTFSSVSLGQIQESVQEFVPIAEIIIRYSAGNWTLTSVSKLSGSLRLQQSTPSVNVPQDLLTFADEFDVFVTTSNVDLHNATARNIELSTSAANRGVYLQCNTINSDGTDRYAATGAASYIGTSSAVPFSASYAPSGTAGAVPVFVNLISTTTTGLVSLPASNSALIVAGIKNVATVEAVDSRIASSFTEGFKFSRGGFISGNYSGGEADIPYSDWAEDGASLSQIGRGVKASVAGRVTAVTLQFDPTYMGANCTAYIRKNGTKTDLGTVTTAAKYATFAPVGYTFAAGDEILMGFYSASSGVSFGAPTATVFIRQL